MSHEPIVLNIFVRVPDAGQHSLQYWDVGGVIIDDHGGQDGADHAAHCPGASHGRGGQNPLRLPKPGLAHLESSNGK